MRSVIDMSVGLSIEASARISLSICCCSSSRLSPGMAEVASTAFFSASLSVRRLISGEPSGANRGSPFSSVCCTVSKQMSASKYQRKR